MVPRVVGSSPIIYPTLIRLTKFLNGVAINEALKKQLTSELNFVSLFHLGAFFLYSTILQLTWLKLQNTIVIVSTF